MVVLLRLCKRKFRFDSYWRRGMDCGWLKEKRNTNSAPEDASFFIQWAQYEYPIGTPVYSSWHCRWQQFFFQNRFGNVDFVNVQCNICNFGAQSRAKTWILLIIKPQQHKVYNQKCKNVLSIWASVIYMWHKNLKKMMLEGLFVYVCTALTLRAL